MLRVETVFMRYLCPKVDEEVDVRIDRLRDAESKRVLSQKFECERSTECCLNTDDKAELCPHPEAKRLTAQQEQSAR